MKDYNYERFTDDNIERAIRDAAGVENKTKFLHRRLELLLRTGKLLMESAADTSRIYRSLNRVAAFLGLPEDKLHIYVDYNMLMVNFGDEAHSYTKFQHCDKHGINMHALSDLSNLSWKAITNDYSIDRVNAITLLGLRLLVPVLHAAVFAYNSVATGLLFYMPR